MAIALPLIVELFHGIDRAVQWLSGGGTSPDRQDSEYTTRPEDGSESSAAQRAKAPGQTQRCLPHQAPAGAARQWRGPVGPLRLHPARRGGR